MKFIIVFAVSLFSISAIADDAPSNYQQAPIWLTEARQSIKSKNYEAAIRLLTEHSEQKSSADWNNLMGYAHRKKSPPELVEAENTIKQHYKLILSTKVHLSIMVNCYL
jgi:hypothetical protein